VTGCDAANVRDQSRRHRVVWTNWMNVALNAMAVTVTGTRVDKCMTADWCASSLPYFRWFMRLRTTGKHEPDQLIERRVNIVPCPCLQVYIPAGALVGMSKFYFGELCPRTSRERVQNVCAARSANLTRHGSVRALSEHCKTCLAKNNNIIITIIWGSRNCTKMSQCYYY